MLIQQLLDNLWAGTPLSLNQYLDLEARGAEMKADYARSGDDPVDDEELPYLLNVQDGIGVISITGPMTNKVSWYDKYLSVASYPAIRDAVIAAAQSPDVHTILLAINSGGGTVNGVSDAGNLISLVNENVKPVIAFTDGNMCSAAYWLGCSAGSVIATNTSTVGSIGVIATHFEYSKQLEMEGVTPTVFRAGKFKALVNSVEPLTAEAKAQMDDQLQAAYKVFVSYVADKLDQPYDVVDSTMAQGREFFGDQALAAGLVDGISTFDKLVSVIQSKNAETSIDNGINLSQNSRTLGANNMVKKALTQQEIAVLAAGGTLQASAAGAKTPEQLAAEAAAAETAATAAAAAAALAAAGGTTTTAATEAAAPGAAGDVTVVSLLQAQIKDKDAALLDANVKVRELEGKLTEQNATHSALVAIAAKSASTMQIALGGSPTQFEGMAPTAVLAEHARVSAEFQTKFKAGGVAAVDATQAETSAEKGGPDHLFYAQLAAAGSAVTAK